MATTNKEAKVEIKDDPFSPTNKVAMEAAREYWSYEVSKKYILVIYPIFAFLLTGIIISTCSEYYPPILCGILYIVFYALFLSILYFSPPYPLIPPSSFESLIGRLKILEEEAYELYNIHPKHYSERFEAAVSVDFQYQRLEMDIRTRALEMGRITVRNGERYIVEEHEIPYMFMHELDLLLDVVLMLRRQAVEQSARHIARMSDGKLRECAIQDMWLEFADIEAHIKKSVAFENGTCLKLETCYPVKRQFVTLDVAYGIEELRSYLTQKVPFQEPKYGTGTTLRAWRAWLDREFVILFFGYPYRLWSEQFRLNKNLRQEATEVVEYIQAREISVV